MSIDPYALSSLASEYTKGMTSIRGRRVQRMLKREFGGAEHVLIVQTGSGNPAVLGFSASGAALCATDGTGRHASVFKWHHGATVALETRFDLCKDSLPVLGSNSLSFRTLRRRIHLDVPAAHIPPQAATWVAAVLRALT